jgi:hypothetical protein
MSRKLEPLTGYYIRKLLRQYRSDLKSVVVKGASIAVDWQGDLDQTLESLYLDPDQITDQVIRLESLVRCHQAFSTRFKESPIALQNVEQQIFWILGLIRKFESIPDRTTPDGTAQVQTSENILSFSPQRKRA